MANAVFGVFMGILAVHLLAAAADNVRVRRITKPVLMPLLLLWYRLQAAAPTALVMLALAASTSGDMLLLWPKRPGTFIAGLTSFLTAHALYIAAFAADIPRAGGLPAWFFVAIIPYALYCIGLFLALRPYLGPMKAPFVLYSAIISAMSLISLARRPAFGAGFYMPVIGSLLFMASDTILAVDTFRSKIPAGDTYIMAAYAAAQVLIIAGLAIS